MLAVHAVVIVVIGVLVSCFVYLRFHWLTILCRLYVRAGMVAAVFLRTELVPPLHPQMVADKERDQIGSGGRFQPDLASTMPNLSELLLS